ncbi:MAG TPA: plasma-membrane proton-efflux P-type ATPase [Candidatus Paceibacterota bacterium]|nr:plasma-membrane proton-efflux P-type ATPase [Candidatus Paceibacterota bacterium]
MTTIEGVTGLTSSEAEKKLAEIGPNEIEEEKTNPIIKFLKWFVSPITLMLLAAAVLSAFTHKFFDAGFIIFLVALNYGIERWQEYKSDNALQELRNNLAVKAQVCRDGQWQKIDSRLLVPGDVVRVGRGDVIPADAKLMKIDSLKVNQSMITGESMPLEKTKDDELYSGSFVVSGSAVIEVSKTGANTYFGKAIGLVDTKGQKSLLEEDTLRITRFLMSVAVVAVIILSAYFLWKRFPIAELIRLDLSLMIAGIPIALPTVMALILQVGALELAKKKSVVRRLSALEDLANVTLLLSDKTGTLTKSKISVSESFSWGGHQEPEILRFAQTTCSSDSEDPIDCAVRAKAKETGADIDSVQVINRIPPDSDRKRGTATVHADGKTYTVANGAPQIVANLCRMGEQERADFDKKVNEYAEDGFRVLAIARVEGEKEEGMELLGLLTLADPLLDDAADIIEFLKKHGVTTKMQTGDNLAIARHVAAQLKLEGDVVGRDTIERIPHDSSIIDKTGVFAEILPADKLTIVKSAENGRVVAVTGDGANDIPAVKAANVGIAVSNAVDALKSSADVVLLSKGISVIKDGLIEARKVFARMYSYSIYRISESFRLVATVFILGIAIQAYPLTPIQLILIAFLNDIPIISLAFNRVKYTVRPEGIRVKERFIESLLFGCAGIAESLLLFGGLKYWGLPLPVIQTAFFLKLIISGHMLVFVAHTQDRWWRFLPSKQVIAATGATAVVASLMAYFGFLMSPIPFVILAIVWGWAILWMQIEEGVKDVMRWFGFHHKKNAVDATHPNRKSGENERGTTSSEEKDEEDEEEKSNVSEPESSAEKPQVM